MQRVWNQFGKIVCVVVSQSKDEEDYHPFVLMAGRDHFAMYQTVVLGHVSISNYHEICVFIYLFY